MVDADKALVERLEDEAAMLSGVSIERGNVDAGISSNLANEAAARIEAMAKYIPELEGVLRRMIYETTHLSPMRPDGSHNCIISAEALQNAREALLKGTPNEQG